MPSLKLFGGVLTATRCRHDESAGGDTRRVLHVPSRHVRTITLCCQPQPLIHFVSSLSTLPLSVLDVELGGAGNAGVSQAIHTVFHAPARLCVLLPLMPSL